MSDIHFFQTKMGRQFYEVTQSQRGQVWMP